MGHFCWTVLFILAGLGSWSRGMCELYSSMQDLLRLGKSPHLMADALKQVLQQQQQQLDRLKRLAEATTEIANSTAMRQAAGRVDHPVNAYHLLKVWHDLLVELPDPPADEWIQCKADFPAAVRALLKLQVTYHLDTDLLAEGTINGYQSEKPLEYDDFYRLGKLAHEDMQLHELSVQWLYKASGNPDPHPQHYNHSQVLFLLSKCMEQVGEYKEAFRLIQKAQQRDQNNLDISRFMTRLKRNMEDDEDDVDSHIGSTKREVFEDRGKSTKLYRQLCRGENLQQTHTLSCGYKTGTVNKYMRYKEETLSDNPKIMFYYDVVTDDEIEEIKEQAASMLVRAEVGGRPSRSRVSESRVGKLTWLWNTDGPGTKTRRKITGRVQDVSGLNTFSHQATSSNAIQVVNYGLGGHYDVHMDTLKFCGGIRHADEILILYKYTLDREWFGVKLLNLIYSLTTEPSGKNAKSLPKFLQGTGDRMATFLFYLSDVKAGGATVFPQVGIRVQPHKNGAVLWYNTRRSGREDGRVEHAACPVLLGEKWIANMWIHEYGQEFTRPCGLTSGDTD